MAMKRMILAATLPLLVAGCGLPTAAVTDPTTTLPAFVLRGSVQVTGYGNYESDSYDDGVPCTTAGGYVDITEGAQVTVLDASGTKLAVGALEAGKMQGVRCWFAFTVFEVPEGHDLYDVSVGNGRRGAVTFQREQLDSDIALSLG